MELSIGVKIGELEIIGRPVNKKMRGAFTAQCSCGNLLIAFSKRDLDSKLKNLRLGKIIACKDCTNKHYIENRTNEQLYRYVFNSSVRSAKDRKIEFNLTREYFTKLILKPCKYCGEINSNERQDRLNSSENISYNGIDRIDSSKGYTIDNTVPCCDTCNMMKNKYSVGFFKEHCKKVSNFEGSTTSA